jgi:hypothetical protein
MGLSERTLHLVQNALGLGSATSFAQTLGVPVWQDAALDEI